MQTEMELTLEQTQQGVSYEVSVSIEGVEEMKKKCKDKGLLSYTMLISSNIIRVLHMSLVILPEHPSDTEVFTMKMEILLEPTSNKLMLGNPVKKIFLKLNLSDHRILKDGGEVKEVQRSFCHSDTERLSRSDEVLKLKNFKKDATLKLSKSTNQERCSRSQCQIQVQGTSSIQKSMITTTNSQENVKRSFNDDVLDVLSLDSRLRFYSNLDSLWVKVIGALEKMALIIMVANIAVYGLRLSGLLITGIQAPSFPMIPFTFRLFRLEQEKDCLVVDRISNGQWAWSLSRSNLGVRKSTHLNHMLSQISQIKVREYMDKCTWSLAHDRMFSFGNLRRLINDRIFPSLDTKTTWD
ncbi:hypothetical protein Tco_0184262 [Tanacetum coccineum]